MHKIQWGVGLCVGVEEIDNQHRILVDIYNDLVDAIEHRQGSQVTYDVLKRLHDYTVIHFSTEESIMRLLGYPDYEAHKQLHDQLMEEIRKLADKFEDGKHAISFELLSFLRNWLTKHILETDAKMVPYLLKKGVKAELENSSWFSKIFHPMKK